MFIFYECWKLYIRRITRAWKVEIVKLQWYSMPCVQWSTTHVLNCLTRSNDNNNNNWTTSLECRVSHSLTHTHTYIRFIILLTLFYMYIWILNENSQLKLTETNFISWILQSNANAFYYIANYHCFIRNFEFCIYYFIMILMRMLFTEQRKL